MKNCLTCEYFEKDQKKQEGICEFLLPACVPKHKIVIGIFGRLENEEQAVDSHRVGHYTETGVREIKDCPLWRKRIFKPELIVKGAK